jgi:hydroxyethylthiazole kinase
MWVDVMWGDIAKIRAQAPLVHNITNYVVMNTTANALLAIGASPVMAHAVEEVEEMAGFAAALVLNIGTLSQPWVDAMMKAGLVARRRGIPIVLDPVGAGATRLRTDVCMRLLRELTPTIVRGNASEIRALAGADHATKGVDSTHASDAALEAAQALSLAYGSVVSVSGATDLIVHGSSLARVKNGVPLMTRVTGTGCTASALTGAFAAVGSSPFHAAAYAMCTLGIAGELAAEKCAGPGSLQMHLTDALHLLRKEDVQARAQLEIL